MKIDQRTENGVTIVTATERVDGITSPELETYIEDLVKETTSNIILDFSEIEYISSAGLRVVLSTAKNLKNQEREFFLTGLTDSVKDVFEMAGFYAILKIFDTVAQALEQC